MAAELLPAPGLYRCYYCQFESTDNAFKYFDNKKMDQPRHQCHQCHKLFTLGSHGRPQGRKYAKKRNEDPADLKNLSRQCPHCSVADNAQFRYYNNNNRRLQPRFQCQSCKEQFQMRLMGTGNEMRLVHTSCKQRRANISHCKKPRKPKAFTNTSTSSREESYEESYQFADGSFMSMPFDPLEPLEPNTSLLSESRAEEDEQFASLLETELLAEENKSPNADPISCTFNVDNGFFNVDNGLLPDLSAEDEELLALLELESVTNENEQVPNVEPIFCALQDNNELPLGLTDLQHAEFLAFLEAGFLTDPGRETPSNVDTFSSTANVDDGLLPWSDNDAGLIDFEPMAQIGVKTHNFDDAEMVSENMTSMDADGTSNLEVVSGMTSELTSFQQDLMEEDQHSTVSGWNEWQEQDLEDMEMGVWSCLG